MPVNHVFKCAFFFPIAFLVGVIVMALAQLFQIGGTATAVVLGAGLLMIFFAEKIFGQWGNFAILRNIANFAKADAETHARIDAAQVENAQSSPLVKATQLAGFAAGILACFLWSPVEIMNWVARFSPV